MSLIVLPVKVRDCVINMDKITVTVSIIRPPAYKTEWL